MNELLSDVVRAHGGLSRWRSLNQVAATVILGGNIRESNGHPPTTLSVAVDLHRQFCLMKPFGSLHWRAELDPDRIAILNDDGTVSEQCLDPHSKLKGYGSADGWDALSCCYFDSCVLLLCLTTPFLLLREGVKVDEIEPHAEEDETWSVLRAEFASSIATHSRFQDFYFGDDLLMRRHDYTVDLAGGQAAAHFFHDYDTVHGIRIAKRHRAYPRDPAVGPALSVLTLSVDIADVRFS